MVPQRAVCWGSNGNGEVAPERVLLGRDGREIGPQPQDLPDLVRVGGARDIRTRLFRERNLAGYRLLNNTRGGFLCDWLLNFLLDGRARPSEAKASRKQGGSLAQLPSLGVDLLIVQ